MQAKRTLIAALLCVALVSPEIGLAQSTPAAPWPYSAQGRSLPRPDWILAIPARRNADGSLAIWDRDDEWTKAWRVPQVIDGLRVVTLLGDSEDRRSITPEAIDQMLVDQMHPVMQKYGAPALALIVTDGQSTAVAGYVPGWQASWNEVDYAGNVVEGRHLSIAAISSMFSDPYQEQPTAAAATVTIDAYRQNPQSGGFDYRIVVRGGPEAVDQQLNLIASMPGTLVVNEQRLDDQSILAEIQRDPTVGPLETDLATYGIVQAR